MAVVGEAEILIRPKTDQIPGQIERDLETPVNKAAKRMGIALAAAFSAQAVGGFFKDAVAAASTLEEATSKAAVVFGDSSDAVIDFAENATDAFGQSTNQALAATGTFGNLFRSIGLAEDQSAEFAITLTGLASDLASFNDTTVDEALDALRSGLVGETEPLKKFAVNIDEATLKTKALELGLGDGKATLDAAAKSQAAYAVIVEQTSLAQGDFARTSDGLANQQRTLASEFAKAQTELGQGLLPLAKELVELASDELIPLITELGQVAVPLLTTSFEVAAPFIGTTTTILEALLPVVEVIGEGLEKIPPPLLQVVTAAVAFNKVAGPLGGGLRTLNDQFRITQLRVNSARAALESGGGLSGAANAGAAGLSKLNVAVAGVSLAVGAGLSIYQAATADAREYEQQVEELTDKLLDAAEAQGELTSETLKGDIFETLRELGRENIQTLEFLSIKFDDVFASIAAGEDPLDSIRESLARLLGDQSLLTATTTELAQAGFDLTESYDIEGQAVNTLIGDIQGLTDVTLESSEKTLELLKASGALTDEQLAEAEAAAAAAGEQGNFNAILDIAETRFLETADATDTAATAAEEAVDPVIDLTGAISDLEQGLLDSTEELDNYLTAVSDAFGVELDYEDSILAVSDAVDEVTAKTLDLIAARGDEGTRDQVLAEEELAEATLERTRVYEDAESSQLDKLKADEAVADAQKNVTEQTQAAAEAERALADEQRAAVDTVLAAEEAIRAKSDAENAGLSDTEKAVAANAAVVKELDKVAATLDPNSTLAKNLIEYRDDLTGVTGKFVTQVSANVEPGRVAVANFRREVTENPIYVPIGLIGQTIEVAGSRIPFFAEGFYGTVDSATPFIAGEAGTEDVLVVPTAIGGIAKVVSDLAAQISSTQGPAGAATSGGVVISPGAIQVVAGPDSSPQAIAREVIDRLGYELTVRGDR